MKETISNLIVHRLTLGWVVLFTFNSLCASVMAALAGTDWRTSDGQTKFLIVIAILSGWTNTLMAFFNQAVSRVRDGRSLLPGGDTTPPILKQP